MTLTGVRAGALVALVGASAARALVQVCNREDRSICWRSVRAIAALWVIPERDRQEQSPSQVCVTRGDRDS